MWALIGLSAVVMVGLGLVIVSEFVQRLRDRPDPQWRPTGYRYRVIGHDQALGQRGATRAANSASRRVTLESERSRPLTPPIALARNVLEMRRRTVSK